MLIAFILLAASARAAVDFDRLPALDLARLLQEIPAPAPAKGLPISRELVFERAGSLIGPSRLALKLLRARVVYSGEQHDQAGHHEIQLKLLKALHARKPGLAVGLEMVSKDLQPSLDDFLSGRLSDADFAQFWKKAWGYYYELYRPILEYCRAHRVPVTGLNAPISVIRQIAKGGLSSLTPAQRAWLPAAIGQTADAKYLAYLEKSLEGHDPMTPVQKARMLEAMAAWNETMGDAVARSRAPMLVLAGSGHMVYGMGIKESAGRRSRGRQEVVLPYPLDAQMKTLAELLKDLRDPKTGDAQLADHFWLLPKD
ncbi:MAG: ChaN family lipoprotein [Elusimicrobia bacterium]|nr:ChaN family lipoprotein [Elusimicrobiota bacterium]